MHIGTGSTEQDCKIITKNKNKTRLCCARTRKQHKKSTDARVGSIVYKNMSKRGTSFVLSCSCVCSSLLPRRLALQTNNKYEKNSKLPQQNSATRATETAKEVFRLYSHFSAGTRRSLVTSQRGRHIDS